MNLDGHEACMIRFFSNLQKLENFVLKIYKLLYKMIGDLCISNVTLVVLSIQRTRECVGTIQNSFEFISKFNSKRVFNKLLEF
jgi:hypothetical protein